jgi:two-component system OmpR family sensor kinase
MISLKRQLIVWALGLFTVVGLLAGGISYLLALQDANVLLDHQLLLVAGSIDEGSQLPAMQARFLGESREEQESDFVIQVWYGNEKVRSSHPDFDLAEGTATGYSNMSLHGQRWRVYTAVYPDRTVQVSQSHEVRRKIATSAALRALLPIAGLYPLSWILVVFGVSRIFKPLAEVAKAATQRDASSLDPLPMEHIPAEVAPLITEMNGLIQRVRGTIDAQRHFMLDAAHELRTPLAALQLQIENLSQSRSQDDLEARIAELKSGIQRASHLVGQLLHMARYGAEKQTIRASLDLGALVKSCIGDFIPIAEKRRIDLGMIHDEHALIWANAGDLRILFNNLLDNAIRYTPEGGRIDVSVVVANRRASVEILDNGPGIPEELLPRVFDRFFRVGGHEIEGSGIGLAIVNAIASQESAEISLSNRRDRSGLLASVSFNLPAAPA